MGPGGSTSTTLGNILPGVTSTSLSPGVLPASHCFNGVQDGGEEGVDCGGSCWWSVCPRPRLEVSGPSTIRVNESVGVVVSDGKGVPVETNVAVRLPNGSVVVMRSGVDGNLTFNATLPGLWDLTAVKDGYESGRKSFVVLDVPVEVLVAVAAGTSFTLFLVGFVAFGYYSRRRVKVFVSTEALTFLVQEGALSKYKRVYVLPDGAQLFPEFSAEGRLKPVVLVEGEVASARGFGYEFNLTGDAAKSVMAARKIKARKIILVGEISEGLKEKLRPMDVVSVEDET